MDGDYFKALNFKKRTSTKKLRMLVQEQKDNFTVNEVKEIRNGVWRQGTSFS